MASSSRSSTKMRCVVRFTVRAKDSGKKALMVAAKTPGMDGMCLTGDHKDQLEMVGNGIDWAKLKKKLGPAEQLLLLPEETATDTTCAIL